MQKSAAVYSCVLLDNDTADYNVYSERLLDTAMQQRAFQAALALYALLPARMRRRKAWR